MRCALPRCTITQAPQRPAFDLNAARQDRSLLGFPALCAHCATIRTIEMPMTDTELPLDEARRLVAWLRNALEHQRDLNTEMRRAVAELARAFQESLARAYDAAESGDLERVRRITIENRDAWQAYLQQIIEAAQPRRDG